VGSAEPQACRRGPLLSAVLAGSKIKAHNRWEGGCPPRPLPADSAHVRNPVGLTFTPHKSFFKMKWPWYWFNLVEQSASPSESMSQAHAAAAIHKAACQAILAAFQEYAPETTLRSAARDDKVDLIKVAIDELSAHVDVLTIDRIRLRLGVTTLLVVIWSDDPKVRVARALQPAVVERVLLYEMLGRAIAIVQENQIHLAKGDDDRNVRLASKLCGWDIEVMTAERLDADIDRALIGFRQLDGVTDALAHRLVEQGFLTYDDLSIADPDALREMGSLSEADANAIITQAESMAEDTHRLDL